MPNGSGARPSHPANIQDAFNRIWQDHLRPKTTEIPTVADTVEPKKPADSRPQITPSPTAKPARPPETQTVAQRLKHWSPEALAMRQALLNPGLESHKFDDVVGYIDDRDLLGDRRLEAECRHPQRRKTLQNKLRLTIKRMIQMGDLASPSASPSSVPSSPSKN